MVRAAVAPLGAFKTVAEARHHARESHPLAGHELATMIEAEHGVKLMTFVLNLEGLFPELCDFYHTPNEGKRSLAAGAYLKAQGLKRGIPDYAWPVPMHGKPGFFLELKAHDLRTNRPHKATPEQAAFLARRRALGFYAVTAVGWRAAAQHLCNYLEGVDP